MDVIYLLDDDPTVRRFLVKTLSASGFQARQFSQATDLERAVRDHFPAAIITDLYMPEGNGFDVLKTMQILDKNHQFPRLVISSEINEDIINQCYDLGATEYIVKPLRSKEIVVKLKRCLSQFKKRNAQQSATAVVPVVEKVELPRRLGEFEILHSLGAGQSGQVYKAVRRKTNETVALKILTSGIKDPEQFLRFRREIDLAAALSHPNLVKIMGAFREGDFYFYAMENVDGRSLEELKHLPSCRTEKTAMRLLKDLSSALAYCHKRSILHRDLKASNVLIDNDGSAYITDFGLAKIEGDMQITKADDVVGTPAYMAPEVITENNHLKSSDVFSLGLMLLEVYSGQVAVKADTIYEAFSIIHRNEYPRCADFGITSPAGKIIDKMIAFKHEDRYQDGSEVFAAVIEAKQPKARHHQSPQATKVISRRRPTNFQESNAG